MNACVAIVPVRSEDVLSVDGTLIDLGGTTVLEKTVSVALSAKCVDQVVVSTNDETVAAEAKRLGATVPFLRPVELEKPDVPLTRVLDYTIRRLEDEKTLQPEIVVLLEVAHPFRAPDLMDRIVDTLNREDLDSVFTVVEVRSNFWSYTEAGQLKRVYQTSPYRQRAEKNPLYKEVLGLVCATRRQFVSAEHLLGQRIAVIPVHDVASQVDLRDPVGQVLAKALSAGQ